MSQALTRTNGGDRSLVAAGGYIPTYDLAGIQSAGDLLFKSGFFQDVRSAAQAMVKVMAGAELGIPPFAAMQGIHIIKGKPTLSAGLMAGKVKASGRYDFRVTTMTDEVVEIAFLERGEEIGRSSFTIQDARRADTQNTGKFPRNMLYARAMSNGVKWFTPDIFLGPVYVPEEMGATVDGEGNVLSLPPSIDRFTGEIIEERSVQYGRNSDPPRDAAKVETLDGRTVHGPTIDPATNRPAAVQYRNEQDDPEAAHFAPRATQEEADQAKALRHGIGNHKGWMVNAGLAPEDKQLSLYLLNRAAGRGFSDDIDPWTSRKDLTAEDWQETLRVLGTLPPAKLKAWLKDYQATIVAEEAGTQEPDEDPLADEPCIACGSTGPIGSCGCSLQAIDEARANQQGAEQSGSLGLEVEATATAGRGHGDS